MKFLILIMFAGTAFSACADILVPTRTVRAKEIISATDLTFKDGDTSGVVSDLDQIVGLEARVVLYPGRPIRPGDVVPAALIQRNDLVLIVFLNGRLRIMTEGRSLGRGAEGEIVRVMNLASHTTVSGRIMADGSIEVQ